jgi:hypothetical protein
MTDILNLSFNRIYLFFSTPPHNCVILSEVFQDQGDSSSWALSMMVNALLLFVCDLMVENPRFSSGAGGGISAALSLTTLRHMCVHLSEMNESCSQHAPW